MSSHCISQSIKDAIVCSGVRVKDPPHQAAIMTSVLFLTSSDSVCSLVVLHLQRSRIPGHSVFHPEEEVHPGQLPPRLPSLHHVHPLVDRHEMGPRWTMWVKGSYGVFSCTRIQFERYQLSNPLTAELWYELTPIYFFHSIFWCNHQLFHPRPHVRVLRPGCSGTSYAEVPLVEEIPHHYSDRECDFKDNLFCGLGSFLWWFFHLKSIFISKYDLTDYTFVKALQLGNIKN